MSLSRSAARLMVQPDPEQQRAVLHVRGPMLVVAGAGTGKTTVLIERIARLILEGHARADEILALTYTDNAAREMTERAAQKLGSSAPGLKVSTFHAYAYELLVRMGASFRVLDDKQLWIFLRRHIPELRLNHFIRAANLTKFLDDLLDFIRRCQDELVGPENYEEYVRRLEQGEVPLPRVSRLKDRSRVTAEETLARCREIAFVFRTVERLLAERNLGTFGHMIVGANRLLAEDASLLAREQARARFILIDEFQDANFAQIKLLEHLAGGVADRTSFTPGLPERAQNVFAVGDPDQGIYRFRGASSDAFELFLRHFPGSQLVVLGRNRRSRTSILKCAHAVIAQNPDFRLHGTGPEHHRLPLVSARDEAARHPSPARPVEAVIVSGPLAEATDLVSSLLEQRRRFRSEWRQMAILYRIHSHRDEVAAELARRNIPFSIEGLDVIDTPEVRDLLASLGAVVSPADSAALLRVSAFARFELDPEELRRRIRALPQHEAASLEAVLVQVKGGPEVLGALAEARVAVSGMKAHNALLALSRMFQSERSLSIEALLDFATRWEQSPITETGSAGEFLEYLEAFREARGTIPLPIQGEENAVKLMTVHAAKGLEFDHVFVLRVASGSFPAAYREPLIEFPRELRSLASPSLADDKKLFDEEERRLFYVAMTRARDTLTVYGPIGKGKTESTPPGYLRELVKRSELNGWLNLRRSREFQTEIFGGSERGTSESRLGQWVHLPAVSDLAASLSASAIERYQTCPLQFKLEREWRIPAEVSAALHYGAVVHRVLASYYNSVRSGSTPSEAQLIELFQAELAAAGISDPYQHQLYEEQGMAQLKEFIAGEKDARREVLHTEEAFSIEMGGTKLVGRIDRIDRASGGGVVITDYKTGKPRSQEDADKSLQLSVYALAAREKWGYRSEQLIFHNLEGNTPVSTRRGEEALAAARSLVEEVRGKIAGGNFEPRAGFHCASCAYRSLCPETEKRIPERLAGEALAP